MRYLGIDFGLRRIGLAISEYGELATPWKIVEVTGLKDATDKIKKILSQENFDKIVVGLPEGKIGKTVLGFIKALKKAGLNVEACDETLSSKKAVSHMIELGIPKDKRKFNDATAAAIILQNYLDNK